MKERTTILVVLIIVIITAYVSAKLSRDITKINYQTIIDDKSPTIVTGIKYTKGGMCEYTCETEVYKGNSQYTIKRFKLLAPKRAFSVHDTVTFNSSLYY
jgi:hypothetical protein